MAKHRHVEIPTAKVGEKLRVYCNHCSTEYEILLEPKAVGTQQAGSGLEDKTMQHCPFCGDEDQEEC